MARSATTRVTRKNPNMTGPGFDGMDFDDSVIYQDYLVPGTSVRAGASAPDFGEVRDGLYLYGFNGAATTEEVHFTVHILHDIHPDCTPTFHVHWTHNQASPSGDVKWQLDYSYADGYGTAAFPAPTTVSVTQTTGSQYVHMITDDDEMEFTSDFEPDGQILCRLYRDPTDAEDTFGSDAFLIGIDMHYRLGQLGTFERNRPFTSAGFKD